MSKIDVLLSDLKPTQVNSQWGQRELTHTIKLFLKVCGGNRQNERREDQFFYDLSLAYELPT